jgi:hypothetical protein
VVLGEEGLGDTLARTCARQDGQAVVVVGVDGASATTGGRLGGLRDRVEAPGGRPALAGPPGGGTRLRTEIPCV